MVSGREIGRHITANWRRYVLVYLLLVAISNIIIVTKPDPGPALPGQLTIVLKAPAQDPAKYSQITMRYLDTDSQQAPAGQQPILVLIHGGSLAGAAAMAELVQALQPAGRVLAPDMPGFGRTTHRIADYGFDTQAVYLLRLIEQLKLRKVHLIAHGTGAGTALHLLKMIPGQISSLTMLSAVGVQEYTLLGEYNLNHALHASWLAALWTLRHALPHMGLIDHSLLSLERARKLYDADQRPLRTLLSRWHAPLLILHGRKDRAVPYNAAIEHHRLVPQSELITYPDNQFMYRSETVRIAQDIQRFIERVENGQGEFRSMATNERIAAANQPLKLIKADPAGVMTTAIYMLLIALATLISEDLACIGAGFLAARGIIGLWPAIGGAFAGIVGGDLLLFAAGRYLGRPALIHPPLKWFLSSEDIANSARWFHSRGPIIVLTSRFIPGSRLPTFFSAGMLGRRMGPFLFYFCLAAALWTPALVGLSAIIGEKLLGYYHMIQTYAIWAVLALALLIWASIKFIMPLFTHRGRRLCVARYRRLTHWQFWPIYICYPIIICYILYLGLRFRGLMLFTSTNPGIVARDMVGDSKSAILGKLQPDQGKVARFMRVELNLPRHRQLDAVQSFLDDQRIDFPLVCKPDKGAPGKGAAIVTSMEQAHRYFEQATCDTVVQEYVSGREFGLVYYRLPGEQFGKILTIIDKRLPVLTGDGRSTLEQLILDDELALLMAPVHIHKHKRNLQTIPDIGAKIPLVEIGTHRHGAIFEDGRHLITSQLESAIDDISRRFNGFYLGHYNIRAQSEGALKQGEAFTVLSLRGVTLDATHVHQSGQGLKKACATLMDQWRLAFEIGAANARRGNHPLPIKVFVNLMRTAILEK